MAYLEIENLTKSYSGVTVLDHFSASLEKGGTLCLIGDSGSGKTTFLRLLNFLEDSDPKAGGKVTLDGKVLIDSSPLTGKEKQERRENFGLVFQSYNLFPQYNVLNNILLPVKSKIRREGKKQKLSFSERRREYKKTLAEKEKEADNLLESVSLLSKKESYPYQLSGGEAQRVAILRALILAPKVLCFDEPTAALDPKLKRQVAETILSLKKQGQTILVVTHEMELAQAVSDKVIFLEKGKIIESGNREILTSPHSAELKAFLTGNEEDIPHGREKDIDRERARGTLFSLSQD